MSEKKAGRKPLNESDRKHQVELYIAGKYIDTLGIDKIREISQRVIHNEYIRINTNKVIR